MLPRRLRAKLSRFSRIRATCTLDGVITLEHLDPFMDCNLFEHCKWLRHLGKIMILAVLAIVGISWWAVVVDVFVPALNSHSGAQQLGMSLLGVLFSFLICMLLWCYGVTIVSDPGRVPENWTPFQDTEDGEQEFERLSQHTAGVERLAGSSRPRYCKKCNAWKPPRAHHDSSSGRCVLKMDHYCVWVLNTVGLLNYKAFMLFLFYTWLSAVMGTASLASSFIHSFMTSYIDDTPVLVFVAFVMDLAFSLTLGGFLIMHVKMIGSNCTTIEMFEKQRVPLWPYDRGFAQNFMEVFGTRIALWFLPIITKEHRKALLEASLGPHQGGFSEQIALKGSIEL